MISAIISTLLIRHVLENILEIGLVRV
ncbi:hypothetical protein CRENPOLYSF1_540010 [Crenothrix polyspora]|uniref:Uncharacterized protein n=1 Tax=Crenothrix polyspora TaxID=360316 RepID=A0A1R4HDW0_9GAMM|nr:hypothetical protein CRENPOLYSF1_540010 [Crenothrix polyspora]